jgi:hypothetical protein
VRLQTPVFKCQWVKHLNGVSVDNYGLTLVDLKNVGLKDDPWVLANRVTQVFYVLDAEAGKHVVVSKKQKNVGVEMPLFTNSMNIKYIENDFDKNLITYM